MVEVICDTNFLIHLATKRIRNIDSLDVEIGKISFAVPEVVIKELHQLEKIPQKKQDISETLKFIQNLKTLPISGTFADKELIAYVKKHRAIIGTMDKDLKKQIKSNNGTVLSFSNDKIILES